jgi:hypothetical protein
LRLRWKLLIGFLGLVLLAPLGLVYGLYAWGLHAFPEFPEPPSAAHISKVLRQAAWAEFEGTAPVAVEAVGPPTYWMRIASFVVDPPREPVTLGPGLGVASFCVNRLISKRNFHGNGRIERIFAESAGVIWLSSRWSADEFIACVLDTAYYGNGLFGIEAAAQGYFGKSTNDLARHEATMLLAIQKAPSHLDPVCSADSVLINRNRLSARLSELGIITPEEEAEQVAMPLGVVLQGDCG